MFQNIIKNISRFVTLTPEEEKIYEDLLMLQKFPKKTLLLREGEICQFEGFIKEGCVRTYYLDENGFEVTLLFAVEDWWITDIASFNNQTPSKVFIETLEDTEIYMLNPQTKEELLQKVPKFERAFRMMIQRYVVTLQNRLINTISQPATERYLEFIRVYPTIPQRVAQYYIASYLGVSKEFVSTIRKRLASKNK
ncbi:Crp/Fnr family transcriptional regulator [Chryseobacterium oranimense]|jgi:CRP-like cAMP-binding protein|uniref:cAMP-binding domain of CRP or a regulatory subunit of cAMP-dependent protein kinases n=1 Tax=Chryseobacterium oranimense TaxID=421058 RepID=A0A1M5K9J0_9FLAO|nr:Crp/Fnr family transcriptional regulator [Chryseobacterium oranimense]CEJ68709.1 Cyclic nucleotide-binding domain protein [Chryseobacterium oranimense G311]SHG49408.1 cAMP-binding domain of CRP or a regulatory subunit of cAMP-dependent protein kinases [Chryseobacterium oranimense]